MTAKTDITVYHNPKCGTSRSVLALLEEHGVEHKTVLYVTGGKACISRPTEKAAEFLGL